MDGEYLFNWNRGKRGKRGKQFNSKFTIIFMTTNLLSRILSAVCGFSWRQTMTKFIFSFSCFWGKFIGFLIYRLISTKRQKTLNVLVLLLLFSFCYFLLLFQDLFYIFLYKFLFDYNSTQPQIINRLRFLQEKKKT